MTLDVRFLGGLEVRVGDALASLGGPQAQVVFALLAADAGRALSTARLIDELWPQDPPRDPLARSRRTSQRSGADWAASDTVSARGAAGISSNSRWMSWTRHGSPGSPRKVGSCSGPTP